MDEFLKQFNVSGIESPRPSLPDRKLTSNDSQCGDGCGGSGDCEVDGCNDGC